MFSSPPQPVGMLSSGGEIIYEGRPLTSNHTVFRPSPIIIPGTPVILNGPIPIAYPITSVSIISSTVSSVNGSQRISLSNSSPSLDSSSARSGSSIVPILSMSSISNSSQSINSSTPSIEIDQKTPLPSTSEISMLPTSLPVERKDEVVAQMESISEPSIVSTNDRERKRRNNNQIALSTRTNPETVVLG